MLGESRRQVFEPATDHAAERYVNFYLAHMMVEEQQILALAEPVLTDADWAELDAAFSAHCDPLTAHGHAPEADDQALFTRIVNLVPVPIGLGAES